MTITAENFLKSYSQRFNASAAPTYHNARSSCAYF
jgi:hypothetical protein